MSPSTELWYKKDFCETQNRMGWLTHQPEDELSLSKQQSVLKGQEAEKSDRQPETSFYLLFLEQQSEARHRFMSYVCIKD